MTELFQLLRKAAPTPSVTVEVSAIKQRGTQLRHRRRAVRAVPAVLAIAAFVAVAARDVQRVEFSPVDRPSLELTPSTTATREARPAPAPTSTSTGRPELPGSAASTPAASASGVVVATEPEPSPQPNTAMGAVAPSDPDDPRGSEAAQAPQASTTPEATSNPTPSPPPPASERCSVTTEELDFGESASCAFTATTAGGWQVDSPAGVSPSTDFDVWEVTISHPDGSTERYAPERAQCGVDGCGTRRPCRSGVIAAGDVVEISVRRPQPQHGAGYWRVSAGQGHGCPS